MDLEEMRAKRTKLWGEAKNFLDTHTDKDGMISEEDAATYKRMEKELSDLSKAVEAEVDALLSRPTTAPILNYPGEGTVHAAPFTLGGNMKTQKSPYVTSKEYKQNFINALRGNFQNESTGYLREGKDADGGYLVPAEMNNAIVTKLEEENIMRQIATSISTYSKHQIPLVATKPSAAWIGEGATINFSSETFSQISLDAYKLAVGVKVSNELLQDAFFDVEQHFVEEFGSALANAEEDAFINGVSSGVTKQPEGFLTTLQAAGSDCYVTTASPTMNSDDFLNVVYALTRAYRKNAVFVMHDSTLAQIRKFKDTTLNYIWTPSTVEGEPDRLFGYPVYTSAFFPQAESSGDVICAFGDFSRFVIGDRSVRTFKPLRELYAVEDLTAFLMIERVDGRLVDTNAIKLLKVK